MTRQVKCDNCGESGASLISEGYCTPIPDTAPTYSQWEQLWLCEECVNELSPKSFAGFAQGERTKPAGLKP